MTFNFKYEDAGEIKTLSIGVKESGIHFNRSEAVIASTWRTYLRLVTHGDESYYMLEQVNYAYAYTELSRFSNSAFKSNILSTIDWTDESCQLVAVSGMHNFGRNEAGNYYQEITYGDGGSCYLQFFIYTNPETQQSYVANAGFSGFKPHGTNSFIAVASNAQSNLIDDSVHSVRPNIMLLKATMTDDDASSPNYNQDFDVIIIVRKVYSGSSEENWIMIADERLFTGARRNDPSKSTAKGNTPNGFRGTRSDVSDSDTESHIGYALDNGFVNQAGHGVKLFRISASGTVSQYDTLYNCFWNENFWDGYRNAKWNPLSGVLSFHVMPCEPTDTNGLPTAFTTNEQISICGLELKYVLDPGPPITELKATGDMPYHTKAQLRTKIFRVKEYTQSFLDWGSNTRVRFRLPFIGTVPIEVSKIMDGGIYAKYNIDFLNGNCLVQIYTIPSKDVMGTESDWDDTYGGCLCMIGEYTGNCAYKLNFAGNDHGGNYAAGYVGGVATSIMNNFPDNEDNNWHDFITSTVGNVVGGYVNYKIRSKHQTHVIPAVANASPMGMLVPALIIERPIDITPLDENGDATIYENMNGRPAASGGTVKDYKSLDTGEGIFIKGILHADTLYATEDEKRQIESAFAKGVYI